MKNGKVRGITLKENELAATRLPIGLCDVCARAKSHRGSFNVPASPKADVVGGWISADIQGPFATEDMDVGGRGLSSYGARAMQKPISRRSLTS